MPVMSFRLTCEKQILCVKCAFGTNGGTIRSTARCTVPALKIPTATAAAEKKNNHAHGSCKDKQSEGEDGRTCPVAREESKDAPHGVDLIDGQQRNDHQ